MRSALGKGLDALISEDAVNTVSAAPGTLSIDRIRANPKQPRRHFSEDSLRDLTASIKQKGILQPIVVSPVEGGQYEIVAGERRFRAAQRAGLKELPVIIRSGTEGERFQLALVENLQREDLNPMDLAEGFQRLQAEFQLTQEAIAEVLGKDRTVVANTLRFLGLAPDIQQSLREGKITSGHAKALLAIEDPAAQKGLFEQIISGNLTVRHVEQAARDHKRKKNGEHLRVAGYENRSAEVRALEEDLQRNLTRKVEIHTDSPSSHKGWIKLEFYSLDDFEALLSKLKKN